MKKALLVVAAVLIGGATFAQNKTKGLDFHFGMPYSTATLDIDANTTAKWDDIGFQFKMANYNGIWANGILGFYASLGMNIGHAFPTVTKAHGNEVKTGEGLAISGDFMLGPSFGVNIGRLRLQSGLAFHISVASAFKNKKEDNGRSETSIETATSLGIALTPQIRFGADRAVSFLFGTDFLFDFPVSVHNYQITSHGDTKEGGGGKIDFNSSFRFVFTPYIGLGINF